MDRDEEKKKKRNSKRNSLDLKNLFEPNENTELLEKKSEEVSDDGGENEPFSNLPSPDVVDEISAEIGDKQILKENLSKDKIKQIEDSKVKTAMTMFDLLEYESAPIAVCGKLLLLVLAAAIWYISVSINTNTAVFGYTADGKILVEYVIVFTASLALKAASFFVSAILLARPYKDDELGLLEKFLKNNFKDWDVHQTINETLEQAMIRLRLGGFKGLTHEQSFEATGAATLACKLYYNIDLAASTLAFAYVSILGSTHWGATGNSVSVLRFLLELEVLLYFITSSSKSSYVPETMKILLAPVKSVSRVINILLFPFAVVIGYLTLFVLRFVIWAFVAILALIAGVALVTVSVISFIFLTLSKRKPPSINEALAAPMKLATDLPDILSIIYKYTLEPLVTCCVEVLRLGFKFFVEIWEFVSTAIGKFYIMSI